MLVKRGSQNFDVRNFSDDGRANVFHIAHDRLVEEPLRLNVFWPNSTVMGNHLQDRMIDGYPYLFMEIL